MSNIEQPSVPDPKGDIPEETRKWIKGYSSRFKNETYEGCVAGCIAMWRYCMESPFKDIVLQRDTIATLTKEKDRLQAYASEGDAKFSALFEKCELLTRQLKKYKTLAFAHRHGLVVCAEGLVAAGCPEAAEPIKKYLDNFAE